MSLFYFQINLQDDFDGKAPSDNSISQWLKAFKDTGIVLKDKSLGRPLII